MIQRIPALVSLLALLAATPLLAADKRVDFNRDIRPLLSNKCFRCHGPDANQRKADLRLDQREVAVDELGVIVPGDAAASELMAKLTADGDEKMPPVDSGLTLTADEIETLRRWIEQGANYAVHWSYEPPRRPELPEISDPAWIRNPLDRFVLARLDRERLSPSPQADRYTIARRLGLDLTGLPATIQQVDRFVNDSSPDAYEKLVDQLLRSSAYGERWAVMWLDLARYADSAGYADDPPRTIWLYRDWVIRALNDNMPFDQFTMEQIAGDLLPEPTPQQLTATAFHRNTLTNSEGGTNDEEFRNVAIVDRVNTTMQVWMGTTIRCAQCHDHKYDPISQEEFFRFFAFFNQSADADKRDESPLLSVISGSQERRKRQLLAELEAWKGKVNGDEELIKRQVAEWQAEADRDLGWQVVRPAEMVANSGADFQILDDGSLLVSGAVTKTDVYDLAFTTELQNITGLRIEVLADDSLPAKGPGREEGGNFVLTELRASAGSDVNESPTGQFVRIDLAGEGKMIHVAEIEVFSGEKNIALQGKASQSSTGFGGPPERAIDGNTNGTYTANSVTHTNIQKDPWIEIDLGKLQAIDLIKVWNRTDGNLQSRLDGFVLSVLDENRKLVWKKQYAKAPKRDLTATLDGMLPIQFASASESFAQPDAEHAENSFKSFPAAAAIDGDSTSKFNGWSVGGQVGQDNVALFEVGSKLGRGGTTTLKLQLVQAFENHSMGRFRISITTAKKPVRLLPSTIAQLAAAGWEAADEAGRKELSDYYRKVVPPPKEVVDKIAALEKQVAAIKPATVPVMRELPTDQRRTTKIQIRGNFLATEKEVVEGVPGAFHGLPDGAPVNRQGVAQWLISRDNPLTARVVVNRYWEQLFGMGLVETSEDFGTQGSLPSHPQLLDWLAVELMENDWDIKGLLRSIVISATYRQSSRIERGDIERDPNNILLSRGPRFRLSAEMIRDQALAVSGLLSDKMYGPSVQPPRPNLGLKAAFGGSTDWETSPGEDKFRRGLYTSWRRSIPYPSMAAFDAPSRNVCTIRRGRTNTPLQALVTLNDPVYVEAAQSLARQVLAQQGEDLSGQVEYGFRRCLGRPPSGREKQRLLELYDELHERYGADMELATEMATSFVGPAAEGSDIVALACWTVMSNVLLNLDEILSKR
jgi:hypothetical protein